MRARTLSFRHVKRTGRSEYRNDYKKKRNKVANTIKCAKSRYFKCLNPSNPKTFWKLVKCLTKQTSSIPILKDSQEKVVQDDTEKATLLNEFFSSCFNSAQPPLNMSDYNELNQPDQDSCPEQLLCTEDEILEMLLTSCHWTQPMQVKWTRRHICHDVKINCCEHCSCDYKTYEYVHSFWKISYCMVDIFCRPNTQREQPHQCHQLQANFSAFNRE